MKKGFTLIELLAVIAILAIILLIAVPYIINVINSVKNSAYTNDEKMMKKAAMNYVAANQTSIPTNIGDLFVVDLTTLQTNNFITPIKNSENDSCTGYVTIYKKSATEFTYNPYLECGTKYKTLGDYISSGLVFQLDGFDAPVAGKWEDRIGSNDGIITNATYLTDQKAYSFNGSSYITINNPISSQTPATQDWAVEAVVKLDSNVKGDYDYMINGWNNGIDLSFFTTNAMILYLNSGINDFYDYAYIDISNDLLTHVVFNFQNSTDLIDVFVNNVDYSTNGPRTASRIPSGITPTVKIGDALEGKLYSVRIYNRHLTPTEITNNYNIDKQKYGL